MTHQDKKRFHELTNELLQTLKSRGDIQANLQEADINIAFLKQQINELLETQ